MAGKSKYDEFFAVIIKDDTVYKCPHPECNFTYIRTKGKSPGELRAHLRTKHPADFARLEQKERADKENRAAGGEGGEKPKAEKAKKKKSEGDVVRIKADPDAPRHSAPAQMPPPPPPARPETPRSASPPASNYHTPPGERMNANSSAIIGATSGRQRAAKRVHSGGLSPISSTPMPPEFFNSSMGSEVRAFSHYIGQRLDLLPRKKRRNVELKVMMMLNAEEEEETAVVQQPPQFVETPIASTAAAPPPPPFGPEQKIEGETEAPRLPFQSSVLENSMMSDE